MTTTAYHFEDSDLAERVCLHLAGFGWSARWSDDHDVLTHVYVTHEQGDTVKVNRAIIALDPYVTACDCR